MAKVLDEFPDSGHGPNGRVLKEEWFDGQVWHLESNIVDSYKSVTSCRSAIYQYARRRGWKSVKTRILYQGDEPDTVTPELVIQCYAPDPDYWQLEAGKRKGQNQHLWEDCSEQVHKFKPNEELTDPTMLRDICGLFDEMKDGPVTQVSRDKQLEMFTGNQWYPPVNDSNV